MASPINVGLISLLVKNVLRYSDTATVKSSRLVSKAWKEWATEEVLRRNDLQMRVTTKNYNHILKFLRHYQGQMPTINFYFSGECLDLGLGLSSNSNSNLTLSQVDEFITCIGHQVKNLTIRFDHLDPFQSGCRLDNHLALIRGCQLVQQLHLDPYFKWYQCKEKEKEKEVKVKVNNSKKKQNKSSSSSSSFLVNLPQLTHLTFSFMDDFENDLAMTLNSVGYRILMDNLNTLEVVENVWVRAGGRSYPRQNNSDNNNNSELSVFWSKPKIVQLVKNFRFNRKLMNKAADLEVFADGGPTLQFLSLLQFHQNYADRNSFTGVKHELYRILHSSKNSLETLETASFFHLPDPDLPQLHGLTKLVLKINEGQNLEHYFDYWRLPEEIGLGVRTLQEKVPNLKTLRLLLDLQWTGENVGNFEYFSLSEEEEGGKFTNFIDSVENLELVGANCQNRGWAIDLVCGWWERLRDLFPNVKRIVIRDTKDVGLILPRIFSLWPELTSLQIWIPLGRPTSFHLENVLEGDLKRYLELDSVFTGIPYEFIQKKLVKYARKTGKRTVEVNEVDKLRGSSSSLHNLTELKKLDLILVGNYEEIGYLAWRCPVSIISCLYAFTLMPDLQVKVCYDSNHVYSSVITRALEPMKEFIEIGAIPEDD